MNVEGPTQGNNRPIDWADLVAGIRAGDEEAVSRLREIFQGAIRYFLRRALGHHKLESRQKEVFALLIKNIRETFIEDPNRLASCVLTLLRQYIGSQITACPYLVSEDESPVNIQSVGAIRELLGKIGVVDREALRRYYVDKETGEQICRELNITSTRFRVIKNTPRTSGMRRGELNH
jgi:predicted transposase